MTKPPIIMHSGDHELAHSQPRNREPSVDGDLEALAKTIWLAGFERAFDRSPTDPWENQGDAVKRTNRDTAQRIIEEGWRRVSSRSEAPVACEQCDYADMLWKWFGSEERCGAEYMRHEMREGLDADEFKTMLDEHEAALAAPQSPDTRVREALRKLAIVQRHMMASGGRTVHVGYFCKVCDCEWDKGDPEQHNHDCLASLPQLGAPDMPPVCCYCDNDLSCAHCGMEQPSENGSLRLPKSPDVR